MKLENQVCSLRLSKRLKELGVKQESHFWWIQNDYHPAESEPWELFCSDNDPELSRQETDCSAFTVAELGEMLPTECVMQGEKRKMEIMRNSDGRWETCYLGHDDFRSFFADTEADSRAQMLVYLIDNGLVKP